MQTYLIIKEIFDKVVSIIFIIFFFPLFIILILFNLLLNGKPIFYIQERSGKNKKKINLIKLRTIKLDNDDLTKVKYTTLGLFFRKSGLDEIFQLFNILKGDLSLVGPRPLYMKYNDLYDDQQIIRLTVKPGLTGLAQIRQHNDISWEQKIKYDLEYVEKMNLLLDIKIILKTLYKVVQRIFDSNFLTISNEFKGNSKDE